MQSTQQVDLWPCIYGGTAPLPKKTTTTTTTRRRRTRRIDRLLDAVEEPDGLRRRIQWLGVYVEKANAHHA
jgi:hypothetical protein